jgi:diaminopimelate epimerase
MRFPFTKMHGCGNDFVVLDARAQALALTPAQAAVLADRRRGIGCDQVITIEADAQADARLRFWNPDGSESGACGNGTRCAAALIADGRTRLSLRTAGGLLAAEMLADGRVRVDMGAPRVRWDEIPLAYEADTLHLQLAHGPVADPAAASMGNPHATFFVPDAAALDIAAIGPALEHAALFPERANIGFAQILSPDRIRLRVWERGAGLTLACGSGSCAALVNAHRRGLADRAATIVVDGGELDVAWTDAGHVLMTGPVAVAFTGVADLP